MLGISRLLAADVLCVPVCLGLSLSMSACLVAQEQGTGRVRGMVVSCPRGGEIWGSPQMAESLQAISRLGVDWIAIHPYAGVRRDGTVRFTSASQQDYLARAVAMAGDADMQLFWKPHLAYWGSFHWRGTIHFGDDETAWRRFFDGYRAFIVDQAAFAESAGVELFAVGVEYERTTQREGEWRRIIAAVRSVYSGRITYAANWDSLERVPFWDAVDLIGVHAYFPLATSRSATRDDFLRAWNGPLQQLQRLSQAHGGKPLLVAEIGYSRSLDAAIEPWRPGVDDSPEARALRRTLIEVALERLETEPLVQGLFWWKWIPGDDRWDRDFSMKDPEARSALADVWSRPGSTAPAAESQP